MKNIIILGSNGMLGHYIDTYFRSTYAVHALTRDILDVTLNLIDFGEIIDRYLSKTMDNIVINCIGLIPQRQESETSKYYIINSVFPQLLSKYCQKNQIYLIFPATDCVYDGICGNYDETSECNSLTHYGISKALGENVPYGTIIRCSIIGEERLNKKSLLEWVKGSSGQINGYTNHYWNGITCLEYCKVIEKIICRELYWHGVRHIHSPDTVSKYELVKMINNIYQCNLDIKSVSTNEINRALRSAHDDIFDIPILQLQLTELKQYSNFINNE